MGKCKESTGDNQRSLMSRLILLIICQVGNNPINLYTKLPENKSCMVVFFRILMSCK